ncbi:MAG: hypothetical protein WC657_00725 [Candidatus Paceibacterota bacterium]|jgi:hypothetical protein
MEQRHYKIFEIVVTMVLVFLCGLILAEKINLSTADLGRHIKNGEVLLQAPWSEKMAVLHTNFYSYTENNFAFVNHHWLSGVIFYLLFVSFSFYSLSVFYILLVTSAFYLLFRIAREEIGIEIASILAVLTLPIITQRAEVRPEAVTYFFIALFFYILWQWQKDEGKNKKILVLPLLMLLWINLHVGFIFGFVLFGAFWLDEVIKYFKNKESKKLIKLTVISFVSLVTALVNPFFIKGLLYPLNIFKNYGYMIVENQSILFLRNLGFGAGLHFELIIFLYVIFASSFTFLLYKFRKKILNEFPFHYFLILLTVSVLSFSALRNFPVFALLFLPIIAYNLKLIFTNDFRFFHRNTLIVITSVVLFLFSLSSWKQIENKGQTFGIGLLPQVNTSVEFFKEQKIKGPIFNNYDIGGFLIFNLFQEQKVFVDNRPEAYPVDFFKKVYIPAQENEADWQKLEALYNFNVVFFSYKDYTPWGQNFLVSKISDPTWAPVFVDSYNIIFLKRNSQNSEIIKKYEISKDRFSVRK